MIKETQPQASKWPLPGSSLSVMFLPKSNESWTKDSPKNYVRNKKARFKFESNKELLRRKAKEKGKKNAEKEETSPDWTQIVCLQTN